MTGTNLGESTKQPSFKSIFHAWVIGKTNDPKLFCWP